MLRGTCSKLFGAAGAALIATAALAQDPPRPPSAPTSFGAAPARTSTSFFSSVLMPRVDARLRGDTAAALDFVNPSANPWMRDTKAVERVQVNAIRATKGAMKRYLVERFGLDAWSVPLSGGRGQGGLDAMRTNSGGTRLRFGISHMAPRAEVLVPTGNQGRVSVGVDVRGRVTGSFESAARSNLRVGGYFDPRVREVSFALTSRF